jgi:DNA invertase Pin-like site-specific DNA recombinase
MVAEFKANLNHLRTREGMAKARAKGATQGQAAEIASRGAEKDPAP